MAPVERTGRYDFGAGNDDRIKQKLEIRVGFRRIPTPQHTTCEKLK
jgi:hypothetical protein